MPKILHIIDSAGLYGAERVLLTLAAEQTRAGLSPVILSIGSKGEGKKPLEAAAAQRGLQVFAFRMRPGANPAGALRILALARQQEIDILHSHGYKGNILLGMVPARVRGIPLVTTLHGWTTTGRLSRLGMYEWLDSRVLRCLDAVVVVCRSMLAHRWLTGRRLPLRVVCNGLPAPEEEGGANAPDEEIVAFCRGGFTIGAFGRLSPEKGYDRLIAGFAEIAANDREIRLLILGEGQERTKLEALVRRKGLSGQVRLPGYRPGAAGYLPLLGLFVLSSSTEGLPLTVLEAMQAGVPVLATRVGALDELLDAGRAGFLLDRATAAAVADGIGVVRRQPAEAGRRAAHARIRVCDEYSSGRMARGYAAVYRQLLARSGPLGLQGEGMMRL